MDSKGKHYDETSENQSDDRKRKVWTKSKDVGTEDDLWELKQVKEQEKRNAIMTIDDSVDVNIDHLALR